MQFIWSKRNLKKTRKLLSLEIQNWFEKIQEQNAQQSQFDHAGELNAIERELLRSCISDKSTVRNYK